jgi:DNA-binding CsgD family transcriptional regulator
VAEITASWLHKRPEVPIRPEQNMASILSHLEDHDARRAVNVMHALAATDEDAATFVHSLLDQVAELVGSDLTTLSLCDLAQGTRRVIGRSGESLSAEDRAAFDRHFREHPLVRFHAAHADGPGQRISDCISQQAFRHSALFADYYRRLNLHYVLALPLRTDSANVISIVFNRGTSDFRDNERALLEALRRPLAALYCNVIAREQARAGLASLQELAASGGWHSIRLAQDGRPIDMSEPARRLLHRFFPEIAAARRSQLPDAIADWLRRNRNWGLDRLASESNVHLTVSRGGARLSLRFLCDALSAGSGFLLLKYEREQIHPEHLASLPLTPREREILSLVAAGKTNADIAILLTISSRTVQKHLEHVFQKLGVETRTAAAMCALAAAGENFQHRV